MSAPVITAVIRRADQARHVARLSQQRKQDFAPLLLMPAEEKLAVWVLRSKRVEGVYRYHIDGLNESGRSIRRLDVTERVNGPYGDALTDGAPKEGPGGYFYAVYVDYFGVGWLVRFKIEVSSLGPPEVLVQLPEYDNDGNPITLIRADAFFTPDGTLHLPAGPPLQP